MHGSLALKNGVLYVCRGDHPPAIQPYDLDGQALGPSLSIAGWNDARASVRGFCLDEDHRIWIADHAALRLRAFTITGQEIAGIDGSAAQGGDVLGSLGDVAHVAATGVEEAARLWAACGGRRRHALQVFAPRSGRVHSLRPGGDPLGAFRGLSRVAVRDRLVFAVETGAAQVQVFRDGEFHYPLRVVASGHRGAAFEPKAIAPLADGRLLIAQGGTDASAVWVIDLDGRILRVIAECGPDTGQVLEPTDLVVEEGASERETRIAVIDCDGDRVQVFTLSGRCYGSFWDTAASAP